MRPFPIRGLKPVVANVESTEVGMALTKAQNLMMRPQGGIKGGPTLRKLWGFGASATPFATYDALTHPSGIGTIGAADKTIAVRIYLQGKNFLTFFNMYTGTVVENNITYSVTPGERGTFYLGDDGSYTGDFDPTAAGPPLFEVLAYGLAAHARWYGDFAFGQLNAQNGVDDAVAVQLGRTYTPGKWRKRGTNAMFGAATISAIEPETASNTQAKRTVTGRNGSVDLVFTANSDNFVGTYGNQRIKVRISYAGAYSTGPITSTITGDGTIGSPYIYTLTTTDSANGSSNNAIIAFVAADTKAIPILTASGANASADTYSEGSAVFLAGGLGQGASIGLSNEVVTVYVRPWDGGFNNCGYEGPSGPISNEVVLDGLTNKDILVQVDIIPDMEGGRFSHANAGIRIYKQTASSPTTLYNCMNDDTPLLNTYRTQRVIATPASASMWHYFSPITATYIGLSNLITFSTPLTTNQILISQTAGQGIPAMTKLYVVGASGATGFLSLTQGGSAIDLGTSYPATAVAATDVLSLTGTVTNGMVAQVVTTSLGLPGATNLFVINASTIAGTTTFKLSLTNGGAAINITLDGSVTLHFNGSTPTMFLGETFSDRIYSIEQATATGNATTNAGTDVVTFTAAVTNGDVFTLETGGAGLPAQVKLYAINASGSTCKLALYPSGAVIDLTSSTTIGLRRLALNQWSTNDIIILPSGGGAVAPSSIALDTRYYIGALDADGFGFTLASSRLGAALPLGSVGSLNSVKAVAATMVIGSTTEPGRGMSTDQNRPPAHRYMTMAGTFNWCAGIATNESKLYSSKDAARDEVTPEGVDLTDVDLVSKSRGTSTFRITGLWSDKFKLHVHCADGIVIIDPANTLSQQEPLIDCGMVNGMCSSTSDSNQIIFLATNRQMMEFNGARYGNRSSRGKSQDAIDYINEYIDVDEMTRSPESCCVLHDKESGFFWMWFPAADGNNLGFAYDELLEGTVGPFSTPLNITSTCKMEESRAQYVVANKDGYIFSWNSFDQFTRGDKFTTAAPTLHTVGDTPPQAHAGYAVNTVGTYDTDGTPISYDLWYSGHTILETGMFDMGDSGEQKKFCGLQWRSVAGSRGFVRVTFIDTRGNEKAVNFGEMGGKERNLPHRIMINVVDTACKIRFEVFSADLLPWIVRDFEILLG